MDNTQHNTDTGKEYSGYARDSYYSRIILQEQPFYREGMTEAEVRREVEYLNANLDSFFEGRYQPLWKQTLHY